MPRLWGLSPLTDQQIAGVTMASEQAIVLFAAFAFYLLRFFDEEGSADTYPHADDQRRQSSITLTSASCGWIAQSSTALRSAWRTSSSPMFLPRKRWYARTSARRRPGRSRRTR